MQFEGLAGSCRTAHIAPSLIRKGQPSGLESSSWRATFGTTSTNGAFSARFRERLRFGSKDLTPFTGFQ
jgi:hypothetical protein